jgi:hypothetical protein
MNYKFKIFKPTLVLIGSILLSLGGCQKDEISPLETNNDPQTTNINSKVSGVPAGEATFFGIITSFYKKYTFIGTPKLSIPVVSGASVSNLALERVGIMGSFLAKTSPSSALPSLRAQKIYIAIFGNKEIPSVFPDWPSHLTAENYARGFGPTTSYRVCGLHEGDILKNSFDRNTGESVLVHELSHVVLNFGIEINNSKFKSQVKASYDNAIKNKKWLSTYASTTVEEYWAECVQSYFNVNFEGPVKGDGIHNNINTRVELKKYDPNIYKLIDSLYKGAVLPEGNW